jgi:hypothetical protein
VQGEVGGHVQTISLIIIHRRQILLAFLELNVACRARAIASTGVFQMESEMQRDVEERLRFAMLAVGQITGLELDSLAVIDESDLRHISIVPGECCNIRSKTLKFVMTNRTHILLCICLLALLAGLGFAMRAQFPDRIDLPFDTGSTILAAEFAQTPEEVNAVIGTDRRYAKPLEIQQYLDFPFIAGYVALFIVLALILKKYDVPGARWMAWISIAGAVAAGGCDIAENFAILKAINTTAAVSQARLFSLPKWGLVFLVMIMESAVFIFWPRLRLWWRLAAIITGGLWLVAGTSGALFASLASLTDIPWSVNWMSWAMGTTLAFLLAIAIRDRFGKA